MKISEIMTENVQAGSVPGTVSSIYEILREEKLSGVPIPKAVSEIITAPILHKRICAADKMKEEVCDILGI